MTPDEEGLLRAVVVSPEDDLPRLVAADWYDENGQPGRAEFIRLQVAAGERRRRLKTNRHAFKPGCRCGACKLEVRAAEVCRATLPPEPRAEMAWIHPAVRPWITGCGFERGFPSRPHTRMQYWFSRQCMTCGGGAALHHPAPKPDCPVCLASTPRMGAGYPITTFVPVTQVLFGDKQADRVERGFSRRRVFTAGRNLPSYDEEERWFWYDEEERWFWYRPDGEALTEATSLAVLPQSVFNALGEVDPLPGSALQMAFGLAYYYSVWDADAALSAAAVRAVGRRLELAARKPTLAELGDA